MPGRRCCSGAEGGVESFMPAMRANIGVVPDKTCVEVQIVFGASRVKKIGYNGYVGGMLHSQTARPYKSAISTRDDLGQLGVRVAHRPPHPLRAF